jgi:hypothetical protein
MNILAERDIKYRDSFGVETNVRLTVFSPVQTDIGDWRCAFRFDGRPSDKTRQVHGVDFLQALLSCLEVARGYVEHPSEERTHWQGMPHSGLPWHAKKPSSYEAPDVPAPETAPPGLEPLTTRKLGIPGEDGMLTSLLLTIFIPRPGKDGIWHCAFSFSQSEAALVRYGVGADLIEALLNALSLARATYETMIPRGWVAPESGELLGSLSLPYNIGRAYWIEPADNGMAA